MQLASTPQISRHVLIVDSGLNGNGHATAATRSVRALATELHGRGMEVIESMSCEDGIATASSDASIDCILINWTPGQNNDLKVHTEATELMRSVRGRNARLPIFLMANRKLGGTVSVEVAQLADEFIWIPEDTAPFIAGRVSAAVDRYREQLLPPYAKALATLQPRQRIFLGGARTPGRRRLPQVARGARVLRLLRREPVPHRHGHRARRARLAARTQRPGGRKRALRRARVRRASQLLGAERHLGVEPHHHDGLRGRRRNRALRSQLPQVDRAGPGADRRHSGIHDADAQSLRHHRPDSAGIARAAGHREGHRREPAGARTRRASAPSTAC